MIGTARAPVEVNSPGPAISRDVVLNSLARVARWVEERAYRGYEPFDGLSSWARVLTGGNDLTSRVLQQVVRQCPWNVRPLLGVRPQESTKGRGYMARGYMTLYRATGQQEYLDKAVDCLEWLDRHKAARHAHHSWSNHYDFVGRGGGYTKHDPIIVWTSLIGHAYVEAFELTGRDAFLDVADSACRWVLEVPRERTARGDCLSYLAHRQISVHNANMLGASLLARVARHTGSQNYRRVARSAMEYSCSRQRPDGSWWYAEEPKFHWIDNFHTGYNLDSLWYYVEATGEEDLLRHLTHGLVFFMRHFIEENGRPRYYHARTYPVDIQCAAQAIDTLVLLADLDPECMDLATRVAAWTIRNMQDARGHFHYRQYPLVTARTPMLHWGQATMFKALAHLAFKLRAPGPVGERTDGRRR
jgi:rhamnogalacturonyl hydrolase YesR